MRVLGADIYQEFPKFLKTSLMFNLRKYEALESKKR